MLTFLWNSLLLQEKGQGNPDAEDKDYCGEIEWEAASKCGEKPYSDNEEPD